MKKLKLTPALFILILGVIHLLGASLSLAAEIQSTWRAGLGGANMQDAQSTSQFTAFLLETKTKYLAHPSLFLNLDALVKLESGSFQSIDGERKNESGFVLKEAGAHWRLINPLLLSGGALNQGTIHTELLISERAFPAVRANLKLLEVGNFQTLIDIEQATPTSVSMSTNTTGVESVPRLLSASLSLNYETPRYFWKNRIGAFAYDNLPSAVAYESSLHGNTVNSISENESRFVHNYQGLEALSSLRFPVMRGWDFTGRANYLQNEKAPTTLNRAYSATAGSEFFFVGRKSLELEVTSFRIEPDAVVAYFSPAKFFHANRAGFNVESALNFKRNGFRVGASYSEAEVIYLSPVQSREKSLMIFLETFYANI
ncbi:hypothetical protein [Bdellovibrio sp. HCB337]|uniref:hypothetical protein n=1 Tax=Bdellovibrio sp. HCB337 TaxID=3394358 RepID=UPI0039A55E5B